MFGWKALLLAVAIVGVGALSIAPLPASAAQGTLRVDPAAQSVGPGAEFKVKIIQNADVPTAGAQASLQFNSAVLEIINVEAGSPYAEAQLLFPSSFEDSIASANSTGLLACIAAFYVPGSNSVPSGDADFLILTMRAKAGGIVPLTLNGDGCAVGGGAPADPQLEMLDENGNSIPVVGTDGTVTVDGAAPPPPGVTPTVTATPAGTPTTAIGTITARSPIVGTTGTPAGSAASGSPVASTSSAALYLEPASSKAGKGEAFEIEVKHNLDVPISSIAVQIRFRSEVASLESIEPGAGWTKAQGASESELELAAEQAQDSGDIEATFVLQGSAVPAGEGTLMKLKMRAGDKDVTGPMAFISILVTDADGNAVEARSEGGQIIIGNGGAGRNAAATLTLGTLILLTLGGTAGGAYFMVQRRRRQWA